VNSNKIDAYVLALGQDNRINLAWLSNKVKSRQSANNETRTKPAEMPLFSVLHEIAAKEGEFVGF